MIYFLVFFFSIFVSDFVGVSMKAIAESTLFILRKDNAASLNSIHQSRRALFVDYSAKSKRTSPLFDNPTHGVQNTLLLWSFYLFVKLDLFALLLLILTECMIWILFVFYVNCKQLLEILSEI